MAVFFLSIWERRKRHMTKLPQCWIKSFCKIKFRLPRRHLAQSPGHQGRTFWAVLSEPVPLWWEGVVLRMMSHCQPQGRFPCSRFNFVSFINCTWKQSVIWEIIPAFYFMYKSLWNLWRREGQQLKRYWKFHRIVG